MFNLSTAIFRTNICFLIYFSCSTIKMQSIEAQHPLPAVMDAFKTRTCF